MSGVFMMVRRGFNLLIAVYSKDPRVSLQFLVLAMGMSRFTP
jgi:hypothetical protein